MFFRFNIAALNLVTPWMAFSLTSVVLYRSYMGQPVFNTSKGAAFVNF